MAGGKTNYLSRYLLDSVLGVTGYAANLYLGLYTAIPTATGGGQEVTGSGYARAVIANTVGNWPAASGTFAGQKSNANTITFNDCLNDWGVVAAWALSTGSTSSSNNLWFAEFLGPYVEYTGDVVANSLTASGHPYVNSQPVRVRNDNGLLPSGLSSGTSYYVINATTNTLQLSTTVGGSAVVLGTVGYGTQ